MNKEKIETMDYRQSCKQFARETKDWATLDPYKFYSTHEIDGWVETCDNAHGGIYLDWCFHLTDEEIDQEITERLVESYEQ